MLLEKRYGDPHRIYASYRKEIKNWPPIKYGDAKSYQDFFAFLSANATVLEQQQSGMLWRHMTLYVY